jgi:hypothetical protein
MNGDDTENADVDGNSTISLTATCLSDCFEYRVLNGRGYYTFSEAKHCYLLPSDEHEEERLQMLQLYWLQALQNRFTLAPIHTLQQPHILDVGTGSPAPTILQRLLFPAPNHGIQFSTIKRNEKWIEQRAGVSVASPRLSCSGALEPEQVPCPFHLQSSPIESSQGGGHSGPRGVPIQVLEGCLFRS